ncbi:MAG: SAM hydroxide adenosyltransferase [Patescibacteria group bacterium]
MKKLIIVADWARDSLTNAEVGLAVKGFLKKEEKPEFYFVTSTPSTIHTGFLVNQVITTEERYGNPIETVVFQNTDPRLFSKEKLEKAKGSDPLIIKLKSGIYLTGPNAGNDFSFIKDKIDEAYVYQGVNEEGQFHSRDLYSRISAHLMEGLEDEMEMEEVSSNIIPELDKYYVAHIDNFGNIKTTIKKEVLKGKYEYGDLVTIKIGKTENKAKFVDNLFGGILGELVIYPGSSGTLDNPFLEVSAWQHFDEDNPKTGKDFFTNPRPGMEILLN